MQITQLFSRDEQKNEEDYGNHNFCMPKISTQQWTKWSRQSDAWLEMIKASNWQEEEHGGKQNQPKQQEAEFKRERDSQGGVGGVTRFLSKKSNVGEKTHVRDADSGK